MRILTVVSLFAFLAVFVTGYRFPVKNPTAFAVGDLSVDWGVPDGDPIFVVNNMAPGDMEDRDVDVTNDAPSPRPVGVRGVETSDIGGLKTVLDIVISEGGTDLYGGTSPTGPKTLDQFFAESAGPDGIFLFDLAPSETKTINFKVTFPESAGNEFQATSVVFDLIIGLSIELPAECDQIDLLPTPIIGTSKADNLTGTPGNDLIMGLEGADKIEGNGGDDCILGGDGADKINGNSGSDAIFGEGGADSINGNDDDDFIDGGDGADTINGNNGNDTLIGGAAADTLRGENGEDHLIGGDAADTLDGGNQDDILEGGDGPDTLRGGNGDDELHGGDGADSLLGQAGDDLIIGDAGNDSANGGPGTDTCDAESETNCEL